MTDIIILAHDQKFKAPNCILCKSSNTYTQGTKPIDPLVQHNCKCKNCGHPWSVYSQRQRKPSDSVEE